MKQLNINFDIFMEVQEHCMKINRKYCQHPNIINFYDYFKDNEFIYFYYEYCHKGSLKKLKINNEAELFPYIFQLCLGLDYLHKNNVAHNDLKTSNILIDQYSNVKIKGFKKTIVTNDLNLFQQDFTALAIIIYEKLSNQKFINKAQMNLAILTPEV